MTAWSRRRRATRRRAGRAAPTSSVWSAGSSIADDATLRARVRSTHAHPGLVVVALSPFGLDGPWERSAVDRLHPPGALRRSRATRHARPATVAVRRRAGGVGGGHLRRHRRPRRAATGDAARRSATWSTSPPSTRSMYSQPLYPVTWFQVAGEPFRPLRSSQLPSVHPTADGWVSLQTTTGQQWLDFCVMVGRDDWLRRRADGTRHVPHAAPRRDRARDRRVDLGPCRPPTSSSSPPPCASPSPRSATARTSRTSTISSTAAGSPRTPHGFTQPSVPYRLGGGATPRPFGVAPADRARHRTAPRAGRRHADDAATPSAADASTTRRCRSRGSACSTSPRSGRARSSGTRAPSSAPR